MTNSEMQARLAAGWGAVERRELRAAEDIARAALSEDRAQIEFVRLLGASLFMQDRFAEAIEPFREVFEKARTSGAGYHLGYCYLAVKDPGSADRVLEQVVREFPQMAQAHNLLGVALAQQGRHGEALVYFSYAARREPQLVEAHNNMGNALSELDRYEDALPCFETAVRLDPADPRAHNNLGNVLFKLGRFEAAAESYRKAIAIAPDYAMALSNLGAALVQLRRADEALACCQKALAADPGHADAHVNMGRVYQELGRFDEAIAAHRTALSLKSESPEAHANLGIIYLAQGRAEEAVESLGRALSIRPGHVEARVHLGVASQELGRLEEAAGHFRAAIAIDPRSADAHHGLGVSLRALLRHDEAVASFAEALRIDPAREHSLGALIGSELAVCRWGTLEPEIAELRTRMRQGTALAEPFTLIAVSGDPEEQRKCAAAFFDARVKAREPRLWQGERYEHPRIRIAYLSADFCEHAVAHCIAELLELHDRSKFEVIGASLGADDGGAMRARLVRCFDRFLDLRSAGDLDAAKALHAAEADIVVDLMGYTKGSRPGILAHRPAPVQVGYLGYPGTVGAGFLDYILADRFVVPEEHRAFYTESIVRLPDSYQANDSKREIAARAPTRTEAGLPEGAFVFACFNNSYKVLPKMFGVWMRLLAQVPGSVLWILEDNASAKENLRKEAWARGVGPNRLVFAPRVGVAEYRARCRLADLCLDTLPYNGHGTSGDMLWSGLPVLTCAGRTFAGRVAGSLLHAAGLPELVTHDLAEYEAMGLKLARDRPLLRALRERLEKNRRSAPLFDTGRLCRYIESAYTIMRERSRRGEPPREFAVPAAG
ncbi:MAG TPA: tetratricopeptide repeat protein [Burkholderiales bacterium]|nr:tetratricopeptide repeat protein [Burkholderiales bacterium]